jgi:hypothetical protein
MVDQSELPIREKNTCSDHLEGAWEITSFYPWLKYVLGDFILIIKIFLIEEEDRTLDPYIIPNVLYN